MKSKIYIGVDPGSTTGIAIWEKQTKELSIYQFKSHCEAMLWINNYLRLYCRENHIIFRIEDARKAKPRPDLKEKNIVKAQGVGYVKAYSKDWEAFCVLLGYEYELLPPSNTKVSPEYFERLTGLKTLKGESHKRDCGVLVFGL